MYRSILFSQGVKNLLFEMVFMNWLMGTVSENFQISILISCFLSEDILPGWREIMEQYHKEAL